MKKVPSPKSVVAHLRALREKLGIAKGTVAQRARLRRDDVERVEAGLPPAGRPSFPIDVLDRFARAVGSTLPEVVRLALDPDPVVAPTRPKSTVGAAALALLSVAVPDGISKVEIVLDAAVNRALLEAGNNQSEAARSLGMERKAFVRRLAKSRRRLARLQRSGTYGKIAAMTCELAL